MLLLFAGLSSDNLSDRSLAIGLGLSFLSLPLYFLLLVFGAFDVTTSDRDLTIKNALMTRSVNWDEISEFGTYKTLASNHYVRIFYLKANKFGDRRIRVCGDSIEDINGLINEIFRKAVNARFLRIENVALIPFTKKLRITPWARTK
jgi:hypothetical protein